MAQAIIFVWWLIGSGLKTVEFATNTIDSAVNTLISEAQMTIFETKTTFIADVAIRKAIVTIISFTEAVRSNQLQFL